jgi:hypothetical protein
MLGQAQKLRSLMNDPPSSRQRSGEPGSRGDKRPTIPERASPRPGDVCSCAR